jgi:hypothetical protein
MYLFAGKKLSELCALVRSCTGGPSNLGLSSLLAMKPARKSARIGKTPFIRSELLPRLLLPDEKLLASLFYGCIILSRNSV